MGTRNKAKAKRAKKRAPASGRTGCTMLNRSMTLMSTAIQIVLGELVDGRLLKIR